MISSNGEEQEEVIIMVVSKVSPARLSKYEHFRTFLMSEACAEMAEMVANLAYGSHVYCGEGSEACVVCLYFVPLR